MTGKRLLGWAIFVGVIYVMWDLPRKHGKRQMTDTLLAAELNMGQHVHTASAVNGLYCEGGDSECPLFEKQLRALMEREGRT